MKKSSKKYKVTYKKPVQSNFLTIGFQNQVELFGFDPDLLKIYCTLSHDALINFILNRFSKAVLNDVGNYYSTKSDVAEISENIYKYDPITIFIDNDSSVLAVAHLDTVFLNDPVHFLYTNDPYPVVFCPNLDDRLGVYLILEIIQKFVPVDILLTTNEERGQTTADLFETSKQYNWMFQLDRHGKEPVMYEYQYIQDFRKSVELWRGLPVVTGSFSDISSLNFLKCGGVNFGVGYYNEHSFNHYADLKISLDTVQAVIEMIKAIGNVYFPYERKSVESVWSDVYTESSSVKKLNPMDGNLPQVLYWLGKTEEDLITGLCVKCGYEGGTTQEIYNIDRDGLCDSCWDEFIISQDSLDDEKYNQ